MQKKMEAKEILTHVDHTLLTQTATWEEIRQILDDAMKYDTASACIPASYVKAAAEYVDGKLPICTVCLLTEEEKIKMCEIVTKAGAEYIKTSTGFSTEGATFADVKLMKTHVGKNVKVKAAGGISSFDDAEEFIRLGAERLGTSRLVKLMKNSPDKKPDIRKQKQ